MTVRVRFAPSPTGKLHIGNLRTALVNALYARRHQGQFILRFEDTDLEREVEGAEALMIDALGELGIVPDESPVHGGDFGPYRTSDRDKRGDYAKALEKLFADGLAYECFVSKEELDMIRRVRTSRGLPPGYDNRHRDLTDEQKEKFRAEGRTPVIRFKLFDGPIEFDDMVRGKVQYLAENLGGDPVIVRSNGIPTFAFAGAVDDINQKITHIVRGEDHVTNTASQVRIFQALGSELPMFAHMPMLLDSDGGKLSKRLGSLSIDQLRADGYLPKAITSYLSAIGTSVDPMPGSLDELAARFDFSNMGRAPVRFDMTHLDRLNAMIIRDMSWDVAKDEVTALLPADAGKQTDLEQFWQTVRPNLARLTDVVEQFDICFGALPALSLTADDSSFIKLAESTLPSAPYTTQTWHSWVGELKEKSGRKGKALFMPLRQALTGREHGPELDQLLPIIGEDRARARLRQAAQ